MLILENSISDSSSASSNSSPVGNEPQPESSPFVEELQSEKIIYKMSQLHLKCQKKQEVDHHYPEMRMEK